MLERFAAVVSIFGLGLLIGHNLPRETTQPATVQPATSIPSDCVLLSVAAQARLAKSDVPSNILNVTWSADGKKTGHSVLIIPRPQGFYIYDYRGSVFVSFPFSRDNVLTISKAVADSFSTTATDVKGSFEK